MNTKCQSIIRTGKVSKVQTQGHHYINLISCISGYDFHELLIFGWGN